MCCEEEGTLGARPFFQTADTNGDGTGTVDARGNYSGAVEEFYVQPGSGEILSVEDLIIAITDSTAMTGGVYGSDLVLTNGMEIQVLNGNNDVRTDVTDGLPVFTNNDLYRIGEVSELEFGGGDQGLQCIVRFSTPLTVRDSERLAFRLHDDFSGLVHHYFTVIGSVTHDD